MATSRQFLSAVSDLPSVQAPLLFNSSAAEAPLPGLCAQCLVPAALTSLDLLCKPSLLRLGQNNNSSPRYGWLSIHGLNFR